MSKVLTYLRVLSKQPGLVHGYPNRRTLLCTRKVPGYLPGYYPKLVLGYPNGCTLLVPGGTSVHRSTVGIRPRGVIRGYVNGCTLLQTSFESSHLSCRRYTSVNLTLVAFSRAHLETQGPRYVSAINVRLRALNAASPACKDVQTSYEPTSWVSRYVTLRTEECSRAIRCFVSMCWSKAFRFLFSFLPSVILGSPPLIVVGQFGGPTEGFCTREPSH